MGGNFIDDRLSSLRAVLGKHVASGMVPGLVALVDRGGETHFEAIGVRSLQSKSPIGRDTIFRISSMTKPMVAVVAMMLIEECRLRLDDPIDDLLPELANRRVLKKATAALSATTRAQRAITVRDLLTLRHGLGYVAEAGVNNSPVMKAARREGILAGPLQPQQLPAPDEWLARVARLPLLYHPGCRWTYELGFDVLGVLLARATAKPLDELLRERLFEPLGMVDTDFFVPAAKIQRFTDCYQMDPKKQALTVFDAVDGEWSKRPAFASGASGLVSTVDDCLRFQRMLRAGGQHEQRTILSRASIDLMTTDQLTAEQREGTEVFLGDSLGWGMGIGIVIHRKDVAANPGRFGWDGGLGSSAWSDPGEDLTGILLSTRISDSPNQPPAIADFWTTTYQALPARQ